MKKNVLLQRFQRTEWIDDGEKNSEFYRIFWGNPLLSIADLRSLLEQTNGAIDAFDGPITIDDVKELHTQIQGALDSLQPPHAQIKLMRTLLGELQAAIDAKAEADAATTAAAATETAAADTAADTTDNTTAADGEQSADTEPAEPDPIADLIAAIRAALDTLQTELYPPTPEPEPEPDTETETEQGAEIGTEPETEQGAEAGTE